MTTASSRRKPRAKTEVAPDAAPLRPKDKYVPIDPVIARTQRIYAGILTDEEAEAFAASIGRKL